MGLVHQEQYRHTYIPLIRVAQHHCTGGRGCAALTDDDGGVLASAGRGEELVGCEAEA